MKRNFTNSAPYLSLLNREHILYTTERGSIYRYARFWRELWVMSLSIIFSVINEIGRRFNAPHKLIYYMHTLNEANLSILSREPTTFTYCYSSCPWSHYMSITETMSQITAYAILNKHNNLIVKLRNKKTRRETTLYHTRSSKALLLFGQTLRRPYHTQICRFGK